MRPTTCAAAKDSICCTRVARLRANCWKVPWSGRWQWAVDAEGLIAFELQGYSNDPRRLRDLDDIRQLPSSNRERLDLDRVREYFRLYGREALLDEILAQS